jgi:hypothetical protein
MTRSEKRFVFSGRDGPGGELSRPGNERDEARPDDECNRHGLTSSSIYAGRSGTRVCCAGRSLSMIGRTCTPVGVCTGVENL